MKDTLVMILAGGVGKRLSILSQLRAKPAVPFAGIYRIIDFTLSNVMNSGLSHVAVLPQYKPLSLIEHIGIGADASIESHGLGRGLGVALGRVRDDRAPGRPGLSPIGRRRMALRTRGSGLPGRRGRSPGHRQ